MKARLETRLIFTNAALRVLLVMVVTVASAAAQARPVKSDSCQGPADNVKVMALQDPDNLLSYVIVVKNRAKQPIVAFSIGDGAKPELRVAPFAVPSLIAGPAGWAGTHVFLEGSEFMHWVWSADKLEAGIAPGEFASGFKVVLQPFPQGAEKTFYPDGSAVRPIKVNELPFRAHFSNGTCAWGHIDLLSPENPKK